MNISFGHPSRAATDSPLYYRAPPRRSRWLLILVPLLAIFIGFGSIVWLAYVDGAPASAVGEPPLIKADSRPLKLRPDDPGGIAIQEQGELGEMLADRDPGGPERLMPPPEEPLVPPPEEAAQPTAPEQPSPEQLAAAADSIESRVESETLPPSGGTSAAGAAPPGPVDVDPAGAGDTSASLADAADDIEALFRSDDEPAREPASEPAAEAPAVETRPAGATRAAPSDAPAATDAAPEQEPQILRGRDQGATITAGTPDQLRRPAPAPDEPQVAARSEPPAAANPVAVPSPEASADGPHYRIQLAAVRNESDARRAWDLFQADLGDVLRGIDPIIERGETSNGVFYRVQLGPYASLNQAETLCEELKRRNASCFVLRR